MTKDPAFLMYSSDFITGTSDLTDQEVGQYIKLLCMQHQKKSLSLKLIGLVCKGEPSLDVLAKFKKDSDGNYYNERLRDVILKRSSASKRQRENALKRWNKDANSMPTKYQTDAKSMPLETETENETETITEIEIYPTCEDFWNLYDKKVGSKKEIARKFKKLNQKTKQQIMEYLPEYIKSTPNKTFRKNPRTFLDVEAWHDEIILRNDTIKKDSKYTDSFKKRIAAKILS
jgi:hypothetical protein|tara:strand:- start:16774 stop:17466 length:693 start_codon:yes stop_codon:yes gene_type:complete